MRTKLALVLLLLGIPSAAFADIYVPSLVEMISSPLLWSIYVVTMVITVPIILIIGLIETLVVKRYITGSFWRAFGWICLMNAITSLIRLPYSGFAILWPGFPVSLILTIIAEFAIIGVTNPFVSNGWIRDIRIVDTQTRANATLIRDIRTFGMPYDILWLK